MALFKVSAGGEQITIEAERAEVGMAGGQVTFYASDDSVVGQFFGFAYFYEENES